MVLSRSRLLYIGTVLVSGIVLGYVARLNPEWQQTAVPPAAWPFAVSLILDLAIGQLATQGKAEPLTMGDRFVAVIGAGLIVTAMIALG
ncbi:hypothetical protein [Microvirga mediterraneensis]|uniref:DUF4126 domain-containing protein n=1 Tax=Microvirga mediterraneensis TaxID=2754695 RepID=A0A838BSH8_9HYPH|nr:hypothetical protein [Microvirga mediterraneensis]MBA1158280.1 hypothetical protein [Microvirga mediterraneensis]